jgi:hypothetical protein
MYRWILVATLILAASGCSAPSGSEVKHAQGSPTGSPSLSLKELTAGIKGGLMFQRIDQRTTQWEGEFQAKDSYTIAFDCTGAFGNVSIKVDSSRFGHECSKGPTKTRFSRTPDGEIGPHHVEVNAPAGAKWTMQVFS